MEGSLLQSVVTSDNICHTMAGPVWEQGPPSGKIIMGTASAWILAGFAEMSTRNCQRTCDVTAPRPRASPPAPDTGAAVPVDNHSTCEGRQHGGHEAADRRRTVGGHQGRSRHRDARPVGGWRPAGRGDDAG